MRIPPFLILSGLVAAAGCAVGPDYHRPAPFAGQPAPAQFDTTTNGPRWTPAQPSAGEPRADWWLGFGDSELNRLESLAATNNPSFQAQQARLREARELLGVVRANFFPQLAAQPSMSRQRTSANSAAQGKPAGNAFTYNTWSAPLVATWELDLWGRVRRENEAAGARFTAQADELESARLLLQSEIAADYFQLQSLEAERGLFIDTIKVYQRSLELTENRRAGGMVSDLDVAQAQTQLRSAKAAVPPLELQIQTTTHALAVLCGLTPESLRVITAQAAANASLPAPALLPSELLERRPDVAAAERRVAAANADIGVATSAFYPRVFLSGLAGYQSVDAGTLFDWPSRLWSVGPSVTLPLFTGGRNRAQLAASKSAWEASVDDYRSIVLNAFREVEDQLAANYYINSELDAEVSALESARRLLEIATNRYNAGLVTYLDVATAQTAALIHERTVVELQSKRLLAQVALVQSLGGGWTSSSAQPMPSQGH